MLDTIIITIIFIIITIMICLAITIAVIMLATVVSITTNLNEYRSIPFRENLDVRAHDLQTDSLQLECGKTSLY